MTCDDRRRRSSRTDAADAPRRRPRPAGTSRHAASAGGQARSTAAHRAPARRWRSLLALRSSGSVLRYGRTSPPAPNGRVTMEVPARASRAPRRWRWCPTGSARSTCPSSTSRSRPRRCTSAGSRSSSCPRRVRLRPAGRPHRRPDRVRAALPPADPLGARADMANPVWVDDENFDVTYHVRRSALPSPGTDAQLRELVGADHEPTARPQPAAVGDVPRRGPRERPVRDHHQDPPRDGRRGRRGRHRPGDPRRRPPSPRRRPRRTPGGPRPSRRARARRRRRRPTSCAARRRSLDIACGAGLGRRPAHRRPAGGAAGGLLAIAADRRAVGAGQPAQRGDRRAAALRARPTPTSTTTRRSARRTAARSTTSCSRSSPARCAPG